jgi:uncharacterized Zn finger protein
LLKTTLATTFANKEVAMWYQFRPYVPAARRRAQAAREVAQRRKNGQKISPVVIEGRTIAHTFWGQAWCDNLESYSDFENRLPRGRTYVRNGSVVDLQIHPGKVTALVSGSELYEVCVTIKPLSAKAWGAVKGRCAGQIGSVVELLAGRLSKNVIGIVTAHDGGLFPKPGEIEMECSCPDWAGMCKHVAAVLYGVGARLDQQPDLLFRLRKVDHLELIEEAVSGAARQTATRKKTLSDADVAGVFGIEIAESVAADGVRAATKKTPKSRRGKAAESKPVAAVKPPVSKARRSPAGRKKDA